MKSDFVRAWEGIWQGAVAEDLKTRLEEYALTNAPPTRANASRICKKPALKRPAARDGRKVLRRPSGSMQRVKKPAAAMQKVRKAGLKRPAASQGMLKRPAAFNARRQAARPNAGNFYKKYHYVIEVDESHLNKSKPGALTRTGRVQTDQVWVWGATLPRQPHMFFFRVLEHPDDAMEGRPRGKNEIL